MCVLRPGVLGAADAVIWDLHHTGRLYAEIIERVHLLKAPTGSGMFKVAYSSLLEHMKPKMPGAGVQCHAVAYKGGNSRVTHLWKYRAVDTMLKRGISFPSVSMEAGHSRSVTHMAYLKTSEPEVMLATAGFWPGGARSYCLGRARVDPPSSLLALVLPGLGELLAANPALEEQSGDLLRFLRKVRAGHRVLLFNMGFPAAAKAACPRRCGCRTQC